MVWGIAETAGVVMSVDVAAREIRIQVDRADGEVILHHEEPTEEPSAGSTLDAISRCVQVYREHTGLEVSDLCAVVLGSPGVVEAGHGGIDLAPNLLGWSGGGVVDALRDLLGEGLEIEKDVHLAARAEAEVLAPGVQGDFVVLTIDRGVGAAIVLEGELRRGHRDVAGEIGYLTVTVPGVGEDADGSGTMRAPSDDPERLTLEDAASSTGLLAAAESRGAPHSDVESLMRAAREGDPLAHEVVRMEGWLLTCGIEALILGVDPKVVVLTGSVGLAGGEVLATQIQEQLSCSLPFPPPEVRVSAVGRDAVLRGAAIRARELARTSLLGELERDAVTPVV
ncbi:ROK family protein [Brachybacterium sp. ACRRE]|uniref:ROK family protein n=1 Tax=Brachybacterium sp. ACRRE TaxID=2918184 RepID=UPI001EF1AAD4|nr:ROK family protein [Brachybacterium sp. ACRRE]MCG7310177.1 ROK family protein [Brachybacterium sp. ACRRE]